MEHNCTKCKKEIVLQKVKNNFNLCYLCNFDLSAMEELKKLKIEKKTKSKNSKKSKYGDYKCKKCGELKADNFSVECPDCYIEKESNKNSTIDEYDLVQDGRVFNNVKVLDFDMPFSSMVIFMVKWSIASIPAMLIIMILTFFIFSLIGIPFTMFK